MKEFSSFKKLFASVSVTLLREGLFHLFLRLVFSLAKLVLKAIDNINLLNPNSPDS